MADRTTHHQHIQRITRMWQDHLAQVEAEVQQMAAEHAAEQPTGAAQASQQERMP